MRQRHALLRRPAAPGWRGWAAALGLAVLVTALWGTPANAQPVRTVTAQAVRAAAANAPCFQTGGPTCVSSDPTVSYSLISQGETSQCTFAIVATWGDGATESHDVKGGSNGTLLIALKHTYTKPSPLTAPHSYQLTWNASVTSGPSCGNNSGSLQFTRTCPADTLSGPAWARRFPGSRRLTDLKGSFRTDVVRFIAAMNHAGIRVTPIATLRPAQRAYLMHFSWMIAKGQISADKVPAFVPKAGQAPADVCWQHTDANGAFDAKASVAAAKLLVTALGIDPKLKTAPALNTRHTQGLAIDMTTTWTARSIVILDASGHQIRITSTPHNGLNRQLIAVGRSYGVVHFLNAAKDPNHWSNDGH